MINVPIFLQDTKSQKTNKPEIEDVCNYFLMDNVLKRGMERLLEVLREYKMKPSWVSINAFKYTCKGKTAAYIYIGGGKHYEKDNLVISVSLADKKKLEQVILAQPEDLITEFLNRKVTHCRVCKAHCNFGVKIKISGETHHFCSRFNYMCKNPTSEQFKIIERFIGIRWDYINS